MRTDKLSQFTTTGVYLERDDVLRMTVWNRYGTAQNVVLQAAVLFAGENRITNIEQFLPVAAVAIGGATTNTSVDVPMTDGVLVGYRIVTSGAPKRGQTFVRLEIRKTAAGGFSRTTLASNYITSASGITPGSPQIAPTDGRGYLSYNTVAAPAAGAGVTLTVPNSTRVRLSFVGVSFTPDATVIDRTVYFVSTPFAGANQNWVNYSSVISPASSGKTFQFGPYPYNQALTATVVAIDFPAGLELVAGGTIFIFALNMQAGDAFSDCAYSWEEWIDT